MVEITIGLDYSHNNHLTLEASSYAEFTQFLFSSGYKLGKIQAGFDSLEKLQIYNLIIISSPKNSYLSVDEIEILEEYVRNGGSLLIVSSKGGDNGNKTNLSELTQRFGFSFDEDEIFDSMDYVNLQDRPLLSKFMSHVITENLKKIVLSSACSIKILDFVEENKNIKIEKIINGGLNCWRKRYDGEKWIEEDSPNIPLIITVDYYKGKIVSFGSLSLFSSLGTEYGFVALENNILIANVFRWLSTDIDTKGKMLVINLNMDLFQWADNVVKQENWENISDLVNVSLKYFKDNYKKIMSDFQRIKEVKVETKREYKYAKKEPIKETSEDKILDLLPIRDTEDLFEILKSIEELTGEKYEPTVALRKNVNKKEEEIKVIEQKEEVKVKNEVKVVEQINPEKGMQGDVKDLIHTNDEKSGVDLAKNSIKEGKEIKIIDEKEESKEINDGEMVRQTILEKEMQDGVNNLIHTNDDKSDVVLVKNSIKEGDEIKIIDEKEESKEINDGEMAKQTILQKEMQNGGKNYIYSEDDIFQFEKESSKKAIWHSKPTKAFEEWIKLKTQNVNR